MLTKLIYGHFDDDLVNKDAFRYSFITVAISIIHFLFGIIFFAMDVAPMVIYNIIIVLMYYILSKNMSNVALYPKLVYIYLIEVLMHSSIATIMVGWDYGFMFYTISFIPVAFYIAFSVSCFKRRLFFPILASAVTLINYISIRIVTYTISPIYKFDTSTYCILFYILNVFIGFLTTFLFSALFAIEVNSMQLLMESEQEKLENQASYDPLTHFLNRRSMDEKLTNAHRNAIINNITYSLIMCDVDHFKNFNDTYGHDCGDYVLQTISKIISAQIRAKDSACRWGGEEFLILVNDDAEIAGEVAERIRKAIDNYDFYYNGKSLHVTITLGISGYYSSSKVKTLIEIADKRLYKGKENGRNQVVTS